MRYLFCALLAVAGCDPVVQVEKIEPPVCEPVIRTVEKIVPAACDTVLPPEPAVPDGFPATDEFDDAKIAGEVVTARLVCSEPGDTLFTCKDKDENYRRLVITNHWRQRIKWASGSGAWESKLNDGTAIHDRDRPAGWKFWHRAVGEQWLTPATCSWHRIDPHVGHTELEMRWAVKWPFHSSPLSRATLDNWIRHSHDYERFVARGPMDGSPAYMTQYMPDRCFAPDQFDRNDVSADAHARKTMYLCAQANADGVVCTYRYLRCTWGAKGRRRCAEAEAEAGSDRSTIAG